jgi:hypothetical protein
MIVPKNQIVTQVRKSGREDGERMQSQGIRWRKDAKKWLSKKIRGIKGDDLMMSKCIGVNRMCSG